MSRCHIAPLLERILRFPHGREGHFSRPGPLRRRQNRDRRRLGQCHSPFACGPRSRIRRSVRVRSRRAPFGQRRGHARQRDPFSRSSSHRENVPIIVRPPFPDRHEPTVRHRTQERAVLAPQPAYRAEDHQGKSPGIPFIAGQPRPIEGIHHSFQPPGTCRLFRGRPKLPVERAQQNAKRRAPGHRPLALRAHGSRIAEDGRCQLGAKANVRNCRNPEKNGRR